MQYLNYFMENWDTILLGLTTLVTFASGLASITPNPNDDTFLAKVRRWIDILALNVGKAKH